MNRRKWRQLIKDVVRQPHRQGVSEVMLFSGNGSSESTRIFIQVDSGDESLPEKHLLTHTLSLWLS